MREPPPGLLTPFTIQDSAPLSQDIQITVALRGAKPVRSAAGNYALYEIFLPQT